MKKKDEKLPAENSSESGKEIVRLCNVCGEIRNEPQKKKNLSRKKMENKKPIKRHAALKPLSREHHHGLLLCWKIRQGIKLKVEPKRMKSYTDWFKLQYLYPHFEAEEEFVFPVLGDENHLVKKALSEHRRLKRLFNQESEILRALNLIEEELDGHIRFEERILFNEIQQIASPEQFQEIEEKHHAVAFSDDGWDDHFWDPKKAKV